MLNENQKESKLQRLFSRKKIFLPVTAVTIIIILVSAIFLFQSEKPVSAEELIEQAIRAESNRILNRKNPIVHRKLQIIKRNSNSNSSTEIDSWKNYTNGRFLYTKAKTEKDKQLLWEVENIYRINDLDWHNPLSASDFDNWRKSLPKRTESIEANDGKLKFKIVREDSDQYAQALSNRILESSLTIKRADWRAFSKSIKVRSNGTINEFELTETISEDVASLPDEKAIPLQITAIAIEPVSSESISNPASAPPPSAIQLIDSEIEAIYIIHREHEDLSGAIEVSSHQNNHIIVRGVVVNNDVKQRINNSLQNIPHVISEIQTGEESLKRFRTKRSKPSIIMLDTDSNDESFYSAIAGYFEKDAQQKFNRLSNEAVSEANKALAEAWAVRRLHERFSSELNLSPYSKARINQIKNDYLENLRNSNRKLTSLLMPLLKDISKQTNGASSKHKGSNKTQNIFEATSKVHQLINLLFAGSGVKDETAEISARKLIDALTEMKNVIQ